MAGSHGEIKINSINDREIRLRINNAIDGSALAPANSKSGLLPTMLVRKAKITMVYHSAADDHCEERRINKVYS